MDILVNGEIVLYGTVGDSFFEEGFTAAQVVNALAKLKGKDVTVRLNSGGGIVDEGTAIYNSLKNHEGKISVVVDSVAASAASVIAMAGDTIKMRRGSIMMIHDPMMLAAGNAEYLKKAVEQLEVYGGAIAEIYAERTGRDVKEIRSEMREELWLTADEAIAKGYADESDDEDASDIMAFDYRAYNRTPERVLALSDQRSWSNRLVRATAKKEPEMSGNTLPKDTPDASALVKAETERTTQIAALCTASGVPHLVSGLITDGSTVEAAKAKIEAEGNRAKAIRERVEAARKAYPVIEAALADQLIAAGTSADGASTQILERINAIASATPPTRGTHQAQAANDQAETTKIWDKVVNKYNDRTFPSA